MVEPSDTVTLPVDDTDAGDAVGSRFGRYTVRGLLGRGGMGEVFLAHDPQLDRLVAVKVIRAGFAQRSPEARARFQREAQAMARLNHPNVVAVYDAGAAGDTIYVAMERIDGPTLAAWLGERPREIAEIVDVFVQAGRGLAAAHAAGLVHRDFKPSNVMLGDRVRVVDFGLARPDSTVDSDASTVDVQVDLTPTPLDASITGAGRVLGTPAYMAPEQRAVQRWGPLADQYSFAAALHEAVTGALPGGEPGTRSVPAWLKRVLDRALEPVPEDRYPSMDRLLAALERGRTQKRRRAVALGTALALAATTAMVVASPRAGDPCGDASHRMIGAWDPARRTIARAAFLAASPSGEPTWRHVESSVDGYARTWIDASNEACRATRVEGRLSEAVLDRRTSCLDRRRSKLAALVDQWTAGGKGALAKADEAVAALPAITSCNDTGALLARAGLPIDPAARAKIAEVRADIDRGEAMLLTGQHAQLAEQLPALVAAANATGWNQVRGEALFLQGRTSSQLARPEAETQLLAANQLATEAHDDRLAAEALVQLVSYLGNDAQSAERAFLVADLADAAVTRLDTDPELQALVLRARGDAHLTLSQHVEARKRFTQAHALVTAARGATSRPALEIQIRLASAARKAGDVAESRRLAEDALAGLTALLGADHPLIARTLAELAGGAYSQDDYDTAADYMTRASAMIARATGADSPQSASALQNLANVQFQRGKIEEAKTLYTRVLEIRERVFGPDHPSLATPLEGLASVHQWRREIEPAVALLQRALTIVTKVRGPDHRDVAHALDHLGTALASNGAREEGLSYHRRALDVRTRALGADHPLTLHSAVQVAMTLVELKRHDEARRIVVEAIPAIEQSGASPAKALAVRAECELAGGDARSAAVTAQRAITACQTASANNPECGWMHWIRARSLGKLGRRDEAIAAATEAERLAMATESPEDAARFRAWIVAERRRRR